MTKDDIQLLFEYDRWANDRVLQAVSVLTLEQFTRDLGGGFRSVRDTLVHIIGSEWSWIVYWKEPCPSAALLDQLWDRHDIIFQPNLFPNFAAVRLKWAEIEKEQVEFADSLTQASLGKLFPVRTVQLSLGNLMQHVANHSTYHRGQIALMLRQLDANPVSTDFPIFLEACGAAV